MWSLWLVKSSIIRFQLPLHIRFTNQHPSHPFANRHIRTLSRRLLHLQSLLHLLTSTSITLKCNRTHVLPKHFFWLLVLWCKLCAIATTQANRFFSSSAPFIFCFDCSFLVANISNTINIVIATITIIIISCSSTYTLFTATALSTLWPFLS